MKRYYSIIILSIFLLFTAHIGSAQVQVDNEFKQSFLDRINDVRARGCNCGNTFMPPAPPLNWNNQLELASMKHAKDMSDHHYFSHTSRNGHSMTDRVIAAGYAYTGFKSYTVGENIAMGQTNIPEVMTGWLKSEGHCKNLMNPSFKEVGVTRYNDYWVQDFGGRESFSTREQEMIKSGEVRLIQKHPRH